MSSGNTLGDLVNIIDLCQYKNQSLSVRDTEGWISLFLVIEGHVSVTECHPAIGEDKQLQIDGQSVYCTRHNVRRKVAVESWAKGYILQLEESVLCWRGLGRSAGDKYQAAFYRLIEHPSLLLVDVSEMQRIGLICEMFADESVRDSRIGAQIATCVIDLLLMLLIRNAETMEVNDKPVNLLIHKFNRLLEEQYKTEKKVSGYARKLFVTAGYLNAIVKRDTGHSVGYHIRKRVTTEALRQARYMDTSVKEVADILGFTDPAHFSKFFKKATGVTFSSFRRAKNNAEAA